jgi:hypothetical protein
VARFLQPKGFRHLGCFGDAIAKANSGILHRRPCHVAEIADPTAHPAVPALIADYLANPLREEYFENTLA